MTWGARHQGRAGLPNYLPRADCRRRGERGNGGRGFQAPSSPTLYRWRPIFRLCFTHDNDAARVQSPEQVPASCRERSRSDRQLGLQNSFPHVLLLLFQAIALCQLSLPAQVLSPGLPGSWICPWAAGRTGAHTRALARKRWRSSHLVSPSLIQHPSVRGFESPAWSQVACLTPDQSGYFISLCLTFPSVK